MKYASIILSAALFFSAHLGQAQTYTYDWLLDDNNLDVSLGASDWFGHDLDIIGDINNDGNLEFVVGAPLDDEGGNDVGAIYIMSLIGNTNQQRFITKIDASTVGSEDGQNIPLAANDQFGRSVAVLPDYDGDGINEIAVGAPYTDYDNGTTTKLNTGAVYILFIDQNGQLKKRNVIKTTQVQDLANHNAPNFGWSVEAIPDIDSDGHPDLAVGAWGVDYNSTLNKNQGGIYIVYLDGDGFHNGNTAFNTASMSSFTNLINGERFGTRIQFLGDKDGDGKKEIAVSSCNYKYSGTQVGGVRIIELNFSTRSQFTLDQWQNYSKGIVAADNSNLLGLDNNSWFGYGLAYYDLDHDGYKDFLIGAPRHNEGGIVQTGSLWVLFGTDSPNYGQIKKIQKIAPTGLVSQLSSKDHLGQGIVAFMDLQTRKDNLYVTLFKHDAPPNNSGGLVKLSASSVITTAETFVESSIYKDNNNVILYNETLMVYFEEAYPNVSTLNYEILNLSTGSKLTSLPSVSTIKGTNELSIDLSGKLTSGNSYEIKMRDGKGREQTLTFKYNG